MSRPWIAFCPPLTAAFPPTTPLVHNHRHRAHNPATPRRRRPVSSSFSTPPQNPFPHRAKDYYTNVGTVIDTLRIDVPQMLERTPDMSIYTEHLTFSDNSGYRITGKEPYKTILWLMRAQCKLVFTAAFVEVQSLYHSNNEGAVYLRWRMTAHPRWRGVTCVVDGISVYRLDNNGWVYQHALENLPRRRDPTVFTKLTDVRVREGRVVGAGAGAGGLPGWYRSLYQPVDYRVLDDVEQSVEQLCD